MRQKPSAVEVEPVRALQRRAARLIRRGEARKAVMVLREASALEPNGAMYTRLGHALLCAGKKSEALQSLKQALYCFRHDDMRGRARTVARMILALDPHDATALKRAA